MHFDLPAHVETHDGRGPKQLKKKICIQADFWCYILSLVGNNILSYKQELNGSWRWRTQALI